MVPLQIQGGESDQHKAGKERFRRILTESGFQVGTEERRATVGSPRVKEARPFAYDVYGEGLFTIHSKNESHSLAVYVRIVGEVDGVVGHRKSKDNFIKDTVRERTIEESEKGHPYVIRINTEDLIGKYKLTDEELWQEIQWQLRTKIKARLAKS